MLLILWEKSGSNRLVTATKMKATGSLRLVKAWPITYRTVDISKTVKNNSTYLNLVPIPLFSRR